MEQIDNTTVLERCIRKSLDKWKIAYNVEDYPELKAEDKF